MMQSEKSRKHRRTILISACLALTVGALIGLNNALTLRTYTIISKKVTKSIRIALLTDLHSCSYGEGQRELLDAVAGQQPDVVLLGGDIVDDLLPEENAWVMVQGLAQRYPTYYVTGNHEYRSGKVETIRQTMEQCGVTVLEGECHTLLLEGQLIQICGVDDPRCGESMWQDQLDAAAKEINLDNFSLLLTHRPELVDSYAECGFDLILAGHAHGGQWRLPGIINGFLAPNQGFFPAYAGGCYPLGEGTMVVSRGLARESTRVPRVFNPPELVIIDVTPGS